MHVAFCLIVAPKHLCACVFLRVRVRVRVCVGVRVRGRGRGRGCEASHLCARV